MNYIIKFFKKIFLQKGIRIPEEKIQSNKKKINFISLSKIFIIPLQQHLGEEGDLCISTGDKVLRGQPLTLGFNKMLPVHSPTSGYIKKIGLHKVVCHITSSISLKTCIFLIPDFKDISINYKKLKKYKEVNKQKLINKIYQSGISGLSGSGFPSSIKLEYGNLKKIKIIIINATECEPYITADDRLIQNYSEEIIKGCKILSWILKTNEVLIGIEDNKIHAIKNIKKILAKKKCDIKLKIIPAKYPSGSSRILTKNITGIDVPFDKQLSDMGIIMYNVSTVYAIKRSIINGEPLTERIVTITGKSIANPCNVWVRIGTPIIHVLLELGFIPKKKQLIIMGGPMMGVNLDNNTNIPIVKSSNCILVPSMTETVAKLTNLEEKACIRCGNCVDVCPVNLLPQQLYLFSLKSNHKKSSEHCIESCIECGACNYVCPSNIPLVKYFKKEKNKLFLIQFKKKRLEQSKILIKEKKQRMKEKSKIIVNNNFKNKEIVNCAIFRAKKRKEKLLLQKLI